MGPVTAQVVKGNDPHGGRRWVRERDMARVRVGHGMAGQNYYVVGGCLLSLSLCKRGFQELLKVRPSSLLILCGCILHLPAYEDGTAPVSCFQAITKTTVQLQVFFDFFHQVT